MNFPTYAFTHELRNLSECQHFAVHLAGLVCPPQCIALIGTLGAGKTQWSRFFVEAMEGGQDEVASPTFVLVKKYMAKHPIYHMDLYRLKDEDELLELGFEEMLDEEAISLIEWADRFESSLPKELIRLEFRLDPANPEQRIVEISGTGTRQVQLLRELHSLVVEPV